MKPSKCKICGKEEWRHVCAAREDMIATVTKLQPSVNWRGAIIVTPQVKAAKGRPRVHASNAERQRAYRERRAT